MLLTQYKYYLLIRNKKNSNVSKIKPLFGEVCHIWYLILKGFETKTLKKVRENRYICFGAIVYSKIGRNFI